MSRCCHIYMPPLQVTGLALIVYRKLLLLNVLHGVRRRVGAAGWGCDCTACKLENRRALLYYSVEVAVRLAYCNN